MLRAHGKDPFFTEGYGEGPRQRYRNLIFFVCFLHFIDTNIIYIYIYKHTYIYIYINHYIYITHNPISHDMSQL